MALLILRTVVSLGDGYGWASLFVVGPRFFFSVRLGIGWAVIGVRVGLVVNWDF